MSASAKPSRAAAALMPVIRPIEGSSGVVGVLRLVMAPQRASKICRSVKVPPMSTAMRTGGASPAVTMDAILRHSRVACGGALLGRAAG